MSLHLAKDSSGVPSWTMTLSLIPMVLVTVAFVLARFNIGSDISVAEYAGAMTLLSGPILARKWVNTQATAKVKAAEVLADARVEASEVRAKAVVDAAVEEKREG